MDAIDRLKTVLGRKRERDFAAKFPPGGIANKVSSADVEQREYIIPARQINDGQ